MSDLLELQDIHLNYKTESTAVEVIRGVSLKINSNESVAIVGKSGSGKTSLIMLIAGLECPNSGKIIFEGEDISEQQRVAIARSIVLNPKLILADEPSGNLDSENSKLIMSLLFKYCKQNGSSLVLVTHDQMLAKECDRIIEIKDGKII